jgi:glycine cleavage system aminomethyltransferase T
MTGGMARATADEMRTLREAVGLSALTHVVALRIQGEGAFAVLDRLSTAPLYLREGEMRQSLLVTENGHLFADAIIASDEEGYFLFAEGPSEEALLEHVDRYGRAAAGTAEVIVSSLANSHELWGVNGPYAWELISALLGPSVLGMTYLTLLRPPDSDVICFRGGKTGEYGYDLLVPRGAAQSWRAEVRRHGERLDLGPVGLAALDQAALENWQFNIRALRAGGSLARAVTPLELQLQWRIGYDRPFVGADALRARRAQKLAVRLTSFTAKADVAAGQVVSWDGEPIGEVLACGWSHTRGEQVGAALITARCAYPGIEAFVAGTPAGPVALYTRTPPLLDNRSLYVDPHRHSYAARTTEVFPPLVPA